MARKRSALDDLIILPWWANLILAVVSYSILKYVFPGIGVGSSVGGFFQGVSALAPVVAGIFVFAAAFSAFNAWRKGKLLDRQTGPESVRSLSWREFEELVGEAYRRQGYSVTETGGGGADGGVDLILKKGGEKILVQCKHWKLSKVGVKVVRELYGVMASEGADRGIVLSSGEFTQDAKDFARGKPLDLIAGTQLAQMIGGVQKTAQSTKVTGLLITPDTMRDSGETESAEPPSCPRCGKEMVLRTAKKGTGAGQQFWGCSSFPECRGTRPHEERR